MPSKLKEIQDVEKKEEEAETPRELKRSTTFKL